ncbi:MAG: hypothetical protein KJ066_19550 [Acidobacteria bacterium]|nr:hypothetical protein [Acidobacteriota bacterium]
MERRRRDRLAAVVLVGVLALGAIGQAQTIRLPPCAANEQTSHAYAEVLSGQPGTATYIRVFNPFGAAQDVVVRTWHAATGEQRWTQVAVPPLRSVVVPVWSLWAGEVIVSVQVIWPVGFGGATTVSQWTNAHTAATDKVPTVICRAYGPMGASS